MMQKSIEYIVQWKEQIRVKIFPIEYYFQALFDIHTHMYT